MAGGGQAGRELSIDGMSIEIAHAGSDAEIAATFDIMNRLRLQGFGIECFLIRLDLGRPA